MDTATVPRIERDDLVFRSASSDDAQDYADEIGTDSRDTFVARLSDRTQCYLALGGERIVGSSWVTTDGAWTRELRAFVRPPGGAAYVYESFTVPDARGKGIYPFALTNICADLARAEISHLWVAVEGDNQPSLRAVMKAGFEERLRVSYRRRFWKLTFAPIESGEDLPRITAKPA